MPGRAYILGEPNTTQIVKLNEPATVRCLAGGYPKPHVSWWRGNTLLPLLSEKYEVNRDYSLMIRGILLSDLGPYICEAYSGQEKPVAKVITIQAIGPVDPIHEEDRSYLPFVIGPVEAPTTPRPYRPYPPYPRSTPPTEYVPSPPPLPPVVVDEQIGK